MSGRYFATNEWVDQYLSPIYNAQVYRGVLPAQFNELETYRRSFLKNASRHAHDAQTCQQREHAKGRVIK